MKLLYSFKKQLHKTYNKFFLLLPPYKKIILLDQKADSLLKKVEGINKSITIYTQAQTEHTTALKIIDSKLDLVLSFENDLKILETNTLDLSQQNLFLFNNLFDRSKLRPVGGKLRLCQLISLEIARYIQILCKRHGLKCWIDAGTLLGATINGKFIPWDDDIDILLLREDYEKLLKILKSKLPECIEMPTSVELDGIKYEHLFIKLNEKVSGAFIDIIPLDFIPSKNSIFKKEVMKLAKDIIYNTALNRATRDELLTQVKCAKEEMGIIDKNGEYLKYQEGKSNYLLCALEFLGWNKKPVILDYNDIFPLKNIKFEERVFKAPKNNEVVLREMYGDYAELPKDIGINHHNRYFQNIDYVELEKRLEVVKNLNKE